MGKKTRKNKRGGGYPDDTALIKAVSGGDLKSTIAALDRGANPNAAYEKTILNYAFQHSGPDRNNIVYALITGGASLNKKSKWSENYPLADAVHTDDPKLVQLLIELGAPIDSPGSEGGTALYWALDNMPLEDTTTPSALKIRDIIILLLKHGADPQRVYDSLAKYPSAVAEIRKKVEPIQAKIALFKEIPILPGIGLEYQKAKERFEGTTGGRHRRLRKTRKV